MTSDLQRHNSADRDYFENVDGNVYTGPVNIHPPDTNDPQALQRYYLRSLLWQLNQVDLSGIDRKAAGHNPQTCLQLSAIYTALLTLSAEHDTFDPQRAHRLRSESVQEKRLSALTQVNRHQHLVLLGDPGSGKSTFVKFVAMCLAGELLQNEYVNLNLLTTPLPEKDRDEETPPPPQPWNHGTLLPLLVILRDFAARGLPPKDQAATGKDLWHFIADTLKDALLETYIPHLQRRLREQGGLILLDGLDEVPEAYQRRVQIKQAVEDFRTLFPLCRIVVTSRTYAYQQQEWRLQGFWEAVLAPFSEAQIDFFVEHWYGHMAAMRGMDRDNAQGRAELLKRTIGHSERLQDFAKRPLLLTLMASLHAWRGGSLPEKRGDLYAEATDLLLNWWEQAKVVKTPAGQTVIEHPCLAEVLQVGRERIFQAVTRLAFQAHDRQSEPDSTANIAEDDLLAALFALSKNKDLRLGRLIEFLSERAGLLVSHGNRLYTFPHRTFQEYLAACYVTEEEIEEEGYPENAALLIRRDPERWREVVLLAAAKASSGSSRMSWLMVDAFCECAPDDPDADAGDAWCALLAGQALVETIDLQQQISPKNQRKITRVQDWLVAILTEQQPKDNPFPAVERALAGNILAKIGDPRSGVGLREDGLPDIEWCGVSDSYALSRYLVTNAQYQVFINDDGYGTQDFWTDEGWEWKNTKDIAAPDWWGGEFDLPNHPVIGVSWYEANAFCVWLMQRLRKSAELPKDRDIRLPSEAEWENAASANTTREYPWGNEIDPEFANYSDTDLGATSAVGCFPRGRNPYGCDDMAGNVWEWCQDLYRSSGLYRVLRGGAWLDDAGACRAACRSYWHPADRGSSVGFRLLRTPL